MNITTLASEKRYVVTFNKRFFYLLISSDDMGYKLWSSTLVLLCLYFCKRDFMLRLSKGSKFDLIEFFNNASNYLNNICTIDNIHFSNMIKMSGKKLNKGNISDFDASFLD